MVDASLTNANLAQGNALLAAIDQQGSIPEQTVPLQRVRIAMMEGHTETFGDGVIISRSCAERYEVRIFVHRLLPSRYTPYPHGPAS